MSSWISLALASLALGAPEGHVVILDGATDPAGGAALLASAQARMKVWAPVLGEVSLSLVASADVPGLKPGFHVVVAGVCSDAQLAAGLAVARAFAAGAYARELKGPALPGARCPTAAPELALIETVESKQGKRRLRASRFEDKKGQWRLVVSLFDEKGAVVEEILREREAVERENGLDCNTSFAAGKKGIVVTLKECTVPRGCPTPATLDAQLVFGAGANQITEDARTIAKHDPPCAGE